ncbi:hypothetical protein BC332_11176 [Capsicum chinense]|nr:hypothetical protein BC332_11176 [Capsicum chinense]
MVSKSSFYAYLLVRPGYESFGEPAEPKGETISEVESNFVQHKGYRGPALHMKEFNRKIEGNFISIWLHNVPWGGQDALAALDAKNSWRMRRNLSALPTLKRNLSDGNNPLLEVRLNEPFTTPSGVYLRAIFSLPNELSVIKILQEFPDEAVKSTKEYLRSLIVIPEKKDFLVVMHVHTGAMFFVLRFTFIVKKDGVRKLIKDLEYVQKVFCGSEDFKGKELDAITYGLHKKLEKKKISPLDAYDFIFQFLKYMDGLSLFLSSNFPASITLFARSSFNIMGSSNGRKGIITIDHHQDDAKDLSESDKMIDDSAIKERSRVSNAAYKLEFPSSLSSIHLIFYVSMLRRCLGDPASIVPLEGLGISNSLSYKEAPIEILDQKVHWLWTKDVSSVNILWQNHKVEEATWEME